MNRCSRCGRYHTGLCGIPAGVTLGYGARVNKPNSGDKYPIGRKPPAKRLGTGVLEKLLTGVQERLWAVTEMLRRIPAEMPEYTDLMDREGKLHGLVRQLIGQIAAREDRAKP